MLASESAFGEANHRVDRRDENNEPSADGCLHPNLHSAKPIIESIDEMKTMSRQTRCRIWHIVKEKGQNMTCTENIYSESYMEYLLSYSGDREALAAAYPKDCLQFYNQRFACVVKKWNGETVPNEEISYAMLPKCFGLMGIDSMEAAGILKVRQSILGLTGKGVLIGIVDTGINYTSPLFQTAAGKSRVVAIWDQSERTGDGPEGFPYGTVYENDILNEALQSEDPYAIVPERDLYNHGNFLAAICAGNDRENEELTGAAPEAELIVVKVKEAKQNIREVYGISKNVTAFQENDLMAGIVFCFREAKKRQQPIVILLGCGTSGGAHSGRNYLDQYISMYGDAQGISISTPAGNEGIARLHYSGVSNTEIEYDEVEFQVGTGKPTVVMELWGKGPVTLSVGFETPGGRETGRIESKVQGTENYNFLLEDSKIVVYSQLVEGQAGEQLFFIQIKDASEGLWKLRVYADNTGWPYNVWMPVKQFVPQDTFFLKANPDVTVTSPGTSFGSITATAYDYAKNILYAESSRGFTANQRIKPDLAAPGVNVEGPGIADNIMEKSGSSIAAAHVAGAAALLFEWSIKQYGAPVVSGLQIKRYFIRGASTDEARKYPNKEWGYGKLNLYGVFENLEKSV